MPRAPEAPRQADLTDWEHFDLWRGVRQALFTCPARFSTPTVIEGLMATDIFTLSATLSATIEESVVKTLNDLRSVWDPIGEYETYAFVRQPQTFPDVVFKQQDNGSNILLGIELKSWYLLAKEEAPTYRFTVTEAACSQQDLLVVMPWVLSNVLAGTPILFHPFVESARYCAQQRNYYWLYERDHRDEVGTIITPEDVTPYPSSKSHISDEATRDSGQNFGRLARYGIMSEYITRMRSSLIRGISVSDWQAFFKRHLS